MKVDIQSCRSLYDLCSFQNKDNSQRNHVSLTVVRNIMMSLCDISKGIYNENGRDEVVVISITSFFFENPLLEIQKRGSRLISTISSLKSQPEKDNFNN